MKTFFTLLLTALAFVATAQPQKIHYQAFAVGANGKPIKNSTVGLRLSVLDSLPIGNTLYTETQAASTDGAGQFSIYLGGGTATAGTFANLPWANGNDKFLKIEMDAQGGTNYQTMGTTQLVSVPFAMAAGTLREGALMYGSNGQKYQITIDSTGPKWILVPPPVVPFSCGQAVSYAGESYPTVQIGTQCWFAKNLNIGTMINSVAAVDSQRNNGIIEKYCYNNLNLNCDTFGGLYQWAEAILYQNGASNSTNPSPAIIGNVQGICPVGWHLPSDQEWSTLETYLGGSNIAGGYLKALASQWNSPNAGANNASGFGALPGGYRMQNGGWSSKGIYGHFLSVTESSPAGFIDRYVYSANAVVYRGFYNKANGFSIRCIRH